MRAMIFVDGANERLDRKDLREENGLKKWQELNILLLGKIDLCSMRFHFFDKLRNGSFICKAALFP